MIGVTITTDAMQTARYFQYLVASSPSRYGSLVKNESVRLKGMIRSLAPVRTGNLRDSIEISRLLISTTVFESEISTDAEYAPDVEYGTIYRAPKPFFKTATDIFEPEFYARVGDRLL